MEIFYWTKATILHWCMWLFCLKCKFWPIKTAIKNLTSWARFFRFFFCSAIISLKRRWFKLEMVQGLTDNRRAFNTFEFKMSSFECHEMTSKLCQPITQCHIHCRRYSSQWRRNASVRCFYVEFWINPYIFQLYGNDNHIELQLPHFLSRKLESTLWQWPVKNFEQYTSLPWWRYQANQYEAAGLQFKHWKQGTAKVLGRRKLSSTNRNLINSCISILILIFFLSLCSGFVRHLHGFHLTENVHLENKTEHLQLPAFSTTQ